jgi:hypothetical protein
MMKKLMSNILCQRTIEVVISPPQDIKHKVHVNKDLDWHVSSPAASFKLEEKLGEGYVYYFCLFCLFVVCVNGSAGSNSIILFRNRSFGVVYKAMHLDSLHEIAVKIIEVEMAQTADLQNEIAILKVCCNCN